MVYSKATLSAPTVIFGTMGQLAQSLRPVFPEAHFVSRDECDFENLSSIDRFLSQAQPRLVINPAAYTNVDLAEKEPDKAMRINAEAPGLIARWCEKNAASMVHFSTDYVFNGQGIEPWRESDPTAPINQYGLSKLAGEEQIRASGAHHIILRTSWVYSPYGHNFMKTMLRLGHERELLKVVNDQHGTPTSALDLARAVKQICGHEEFKKVIGTFHLTHPGYTTWFEFAAEIFSQVRSLGEPLKLQELLPISSSEFPTPARRPSNSRLDCSKIQKVFNVELQGWKVALRECLDSRT